VDDHIVGCPPPSVNDCDVITSREERPVSEEYPERVDAYFS
jgi:hypothetical protein